MKSGIWLVEAAALVGLASLVRAGNSTDGSCGAKAGYNVCGKKSHCCRYGWCGNGGEYCAQGCNPLFSYDVISCYPLPVCQSKTYTFGTNGNARLAKKEAYQKVDPFNVDFTIDTGELENTLDGVVLTLKSDKIGAKITSTRAMHYGKVTFEMQTAWSGGVVTAAVLMGDTTEEADIEFTGNALKAFQSNLFYDYVADSTTHVLGTDTSRGFANYTLDWSKDQMQWRYSKNSAERVLRTTTSQTKHVPALPMYVQMSIWPGGESAAEGTQNWAGGKIDWNNARFKQAGNQFQFIIKSVTIECYDNHPANHAYRYVRNKETKNELAFKAVKLEGYGVSKKATPALQLQQARSAQISDESSNQQQQQAGEEVISQDGPLRMPSSGEATKMLSADTQVTQVAGGANIKQFSTFKLSS